MTYWTHPEVRYPADADEHEAQIPLNNLDSSFVCQLCILDKERDFSIKDKHIQSLNLEGFPESPHVQQSVQDWNNVHATFIKTLPGLVPK